MKCMMINIFMSHIIKVCGIQNEFEALGAVEAGANTIGMLLGVPEFVADKITTKKALEIVNSVPQGIRTVMVTHLLDINKIVEIAEYTGVSAIQVHNDLSIEGMKRLRDILPNLELIKAIHVIDSSAVQQAKEYEPFSDMILLDTKSGSRFGGTGKTHDWNISQKIVSEVNIPLILAGGLNPGNIVEAVKKVMPFGIDANSGLEHVDGSKDFEKIRIFTHAGGLLT